MSNAPYAFLTENVKQFENNILQSNKHMKITLIIISPQYKLIGDENKTLRNFF